MRLAACIVVAACMLAGPASAQSGFVETLVEAGALRGTLLAQKSAPRAAVLIVPGSGPTDRDGNSPLGVRASTYRLLAEGLAAQGIATLRIDKRGMFASAAAGDGNAVTIPDYVEDVRKWVPVLLEKTGVACAWVLGHSEGGLVALASASEVRGECGLMLVATPGRPLGQVLRDQLRANPANAQVLDEAMAAIAALEQGRKVDTAGMHPALRGLFHPSVQGFLASAFSYDPARLIAGIDQPVLVLQGQSDLQVGEADARLLQQAARRASLVLLPGVNHVLKAVPANDPRANAASYADPALPLAPGVVDAIAGFVATAGR